MYCVDSSLNSSDKRVILQVLYDFQYRLFAYVHI